MENRIMENREELGKAKTMIGIKEVIGNREELGEEDFSKIGEVLSRSSDVNLVTVHIQKPAMAVALGKISSMQGIREEGLEDFVSRSGNCSTLTAMPDICKKMNSVEAKIRNKRTLCSIGRSDFMEIVSFTNDFLPYYKERLEEIEKIRQEMLEKWRSEMPVFAEMALRTAKAAVTNPAELIRVERDINAITEAEPAMYARKLKSTLITDFGAEKFTDAELKEIVAKANKARQDKLVNDVIGGTLSDCFLELSTFVNNITTSKTDDITGYCSRKDALVAQAKKTRRENLGNAAICDKVADELEALSLVNDKYDAIDAAVSTMAEIYGVSEVFDIDLRFSKSVPEWLTFEKLAEYA